ncbi:glycoside hydrolase family 31 protein [Colwellia sp. KU-HH00111]|uniref:glycoside hydrolase family 31 protein n=1 Tax=Colwellia sp. KU-HH00111 TaxID=3127652 RepID=UPI0031072D65
MRFLTLFALLRTSLWITLFFGQAFVCANAENTPTNNYVSHQLIDNALVVSTTQGQVTLSAYGPQAIEVHYAPSRATTAANISTDILAKNAANLPSFAIKEAAKKHALALENTKHSLTFSSDKLSAIITKHPFNIAFYTLKDNQKQLLLAQERGYFTGTAQENDQQHPVQGFRFSLTEHEKLLGGGERVLGMDRRGQRMPLYNRAHYGYETRSTQMNFSIPAVLSSNKYIVLFDNSAKGWMDLGKSEQNILQFEAVSGRMAYLVFAGETYPELIKNYVEVTGKQPMPPRWALGNYASRFGYRSEQEVRKTVNKFIELDFPLDALILDLYWFGKDIKGHMGNLDWDKATFPTPKSMISDLNKQGVKTVLITEPFVLTSSTKWADATKSQALAKGGDGKPKRFDFYFGNTGLIDVFNDDGKDWFNAIYQGLHQQGVAGWWGDLGEPEVHPSDTLHTLADGSVVNGDAIHNVYGHQWAKMVYENQLTLTPNKRPFILMRSGFAGSQRYGMIPWTGDVNRSWGGLKPQVELSLQMGLLGMAYTHSDLGGFAGGETFNKEMYIRWLQYGVFQPIYRPHAQDNIAPEVVFHDKETQAILRNFIKLRYQLLPYNYTLAYQNSTTGMPLMRPLFFEQASLPTSKNEATINLMDNATSYLWGDAFLVTPVVDANVKSVSVPLPKGVWFDYFNGDRHLGNHTVDIATSLETLPVLVRAGSFIPMIDAIQSTKDYDNTKLTLHYYHDKSVNHSVGEMYEDDGEMFQANTQDLFELLSFKANQQSGQLAIHLSRNAHHYVGMPKSRQMTLVIHNWQNSPAKVMLNNKVINDLSWDKTTRTLTVNFVWQHQDLTLNVQ